MAVVPIDTIVYAARAHRIGGRASRSSDGRPVNISFVQHSGQPCSPSSRRRAKEVSMDGHRPLSAETDAEQLQCANRELAAFLGAVTKLYGTEQASFSAEDWLNEAQQMDSSPSSAARDWRAVTIAASARLASRLIGAEHQKRNEFVG